MISRIRSLCLVVMVGLASSPLIADTVYLKNGAWIDGIVRTRSAESIMVEIGEIGQMEIPLEDVYEIEKNSRTGGRRVVPVDQRDLDVSVDPEARRGADRDADGSAGRSTDGAEDASDESPGREAKGREKDGGSERTTGQPGEEEIEEISPELKEKIEGLVLDLKRQKSRFRVRAQRHLKAVGPPAVPFLIPLVRHREELVRISVFRLFHSIGDDRVIEPCIDALSDPNEYVRDYAHRSLVRLTGESFGYRPLASPSRRELARAKWRRWWVAEKRALQDLRTEAATD